MAGTFGSVVTAMVTPFPVPTTPSTSTGRRSSLLAHG